MATHLYLRHLRQLSRHYMDVLLYNMYHLKRYFTTETDIVQQSCDQNVPQSALVSGILIGFIVLLVLNELYEKLVGRILRRIGVVGSSRGRVSGAVWNFSFYISCLLCSTLLTADDATGRDMFTPDTLSFPALVYNAIFSSFCIHGALVSARKGCVGQLINKMSLIAILWTSSVLNFVWLGVYCMMLVSLGSCTTEFTRIFAGLRKNKWANTSSLEPIVALLFVFHCLAWATCFLYMFPQSVLWPAFTLQVSDQDIRHVLILNVTMWVYLVSEVYTSPLLKMIEYYVRAYSRYIHNEMMEYALFPQYNEVLNYLLQIRREVQQHQEMDHYYGRMMRNGLSTNFRRSKDSVALMQTVRCVMLLKRRLRKRHQQQQCPETT